MEHFLRVIMEKQDSISLNESAFPSYEIFESDCATIFQVPLPKSLNEEQSTKLAEKVANYFFAEGYDDFDIEISTDDQLGEVYENR